MRYELVKSSQLHLSWNLFGNRRVLLSRFSPDQYFVLMAINFEKEVSHEGIYSLNQNIYCLFLQIDIFVSIDIH